MDEHRKPPATEAMAGEVKKEEIKEEEVVLPEEIREAVASYEFDTDDLVNINERYHREIAEMLVEQGQAPFVINSIKKFKNLDYSILAAKTIKVGHGDLVIRYINDFIQVDHGQLFDSLLEAGWGWLIADNLYLFKGIDQSRLVRNLIQTGKIRYLIKNIDNFDGMDNEIALGLLDAAAESELEHNLLSLKNLHKEVAHRLIEADRSIAVLFYKKAFSGNLDKDIAIQLVEKGHVREVSKNIDQFSGLDQDFAIMMIELLAGASVVYNMDKFQDLDHAQIAQALIYDQGFLVADNMEKFQDLDHTQIAHQLIEAGWGDSVVHNIDKFHGVDHTQIAQLLIDEDKSLLVAESLDKFKSLDAQIAQQLISKGGSKFVVYSLDKFDGLDGQIAQKLIDKGFADFVVHDLDKFQGLDSEMGKKLLTKLLSEGSIFLAIKVNKYFGELNKNLARSYQDIGDQLTIGIYNIYKELDAGTIPAEAVTFGVKHSGETGMNELKNKLRGLQSEFISGELDPQVALDSEIARSYLMGAVRFESAEWGASDEESFKQTIEYYIKTKDQIRPLPTEYEPSEVLNIAKIDQEKVDNFELSEQFLVRYAKLISSIKEARALVDNPEAMTELQDITKQKREVLLSQLQNKLANTDNPKAKDNLQRQIDNLSSLDLEKLTQPQETFKVLNSFKGEFDEELREFMFYWAFQFHPNLQNENLSEFDPNKPTQDQLSWALNFIDHITNQETFSKYFTDKKAKKAFSGLINTTALQQELSRWQNQETKGTMKMKFVPSRDLLTEFSGHIGDACWASKYDSILDEFPNFTSLTIVQNPDDPKHEKLAGSALLIETESKQGEQLLVIRGLNPQENVINQLSQEDFYKQVTEYLKQIAEKMGRKLAMVIDDHSGGSSTNRPNLFGYLDKLKDKLSIAQLASSEDTEFNGYDIRNVTYLVE